MNREEILKELEQYRRVPGHGPNFENMTDEQLEKYLKIIRSSFEDNFK